MRSRYSAYVLGLEQYLLATWHASTRPAFLNLPADAASKWLELEVRRHQVQDASHATVEFVARYRVGGRGHRLHELSHFVREDGRWYYVAGEERSIRWARKSPGSFWPADSGGAWEASTRGCRNCAAGR